MIGSTVAYSGLITGLCGVALVVKPMDRLRVPTRSRALLIAAAGALVATAGLIFPAPEARVNRAETRLDELMPVWQFGERHTITVGAPPARVFEAIERVRADEIFLFRTLTWIRRGGQPLPQGILNAGRQEPLIEVATRSDFVRLAYDPPRELVLGAVVIATSDAQGTGPLTPEDFQEPMPPGVAVAAMNFVVTADGPGGSIVSTETRVHASSPSARRRFTAYWRVIYPGSALIRRSWLRAIRRRATEAGGI